MAALARSKSSFLTFRPGQLTDLPLFDLTMSEAQRVDRDVVEPSAPQGDEKDMLNDGPVIQEMHEGSTGDVAGGDGSDAPRPRLSRTRIALLGLAMMLTYYMGVSGLHRVYVYKIQYMGANASSDSYCHSSHHCDSRSRGGLGRRRAHGSMG